MSATGVCDFCRTPLLRGWTRYGCRSFERTLHGPGRTTRLVLFDYWAACPDCSPLVAACRWRELAQRALHHEDRRAGRVPRWQRRAFVSELVGLYLQLEANLTGDVQRQVVA